jgi:3-oxocholest-4-en-26-oate---CoA ligase
MATNAYAPIHPASLWEEIADAVPDAPALIHGSIRRSWAEFDGRAARLAAGLHELGVGRGSRVAIYLRNRSEYIESYFAALKLRAAPVNVNYRYLDDELVYLLTDAEAEAVIFGASYGKRIEKVAARVEGLRVLVQVDDEDHSSEPQLDAHSYEGVVATHASQPRIERDPTDLGLMYTGGTTGMPKGIVRKVGGVMTAQVVNTLAMFMGLGELNEPFGGALSRRLHDAGDAPRAIPAAALMHATGLAMAALPSLNFGGAAITLESRSFDAAELVDVAERQQATSIAISGDAIGKPLLQALDLRARAGRPADLSTLRTINSSGVAWSAHVKERLLVHIPNVTILDAYGATEGAMGFQRTSRGDTAATDEFVFAPGVRILREDGPEPAPGEPGLIAIPAGEAEYYKDPVKTAAVFRDIGGERYAFPGDWGVMSPDGKLRALGRGSSVINTGGEKVFAEEVEGVLRSHPDVADCIVVGTPHPLWGEQVAAVVSRFGTELTAEAVQEYVHARLAGYKVPRTIAFVETAPRHPNGKPDFAQALEIVTDAKSAQPG